MRWLIFLCPCLICASGCSATRDEAAPGTAGADQVSVISPDPAGSFAPPPPPTPGTRVIIGDWMTVEKAFDAIGRAAGYPLLVHWADLERVGLNRGERLKTTTPSVVIEAAIAVIQENGPRLRPPDIDYRPDLGYRIADGIFEIATTHFFDARETELVCYDVTGIARDLRVQTAWETDEGRIIGIASVEAVRTVADLIRELVEPEAWADNGGDLATMRLFGPRLLVEAPSRVHAQIRALLGRLPGTPPYRVVPVPADPDNAKSL
jgi:hypothetical protein